MSTGENGGQRYRIGNLVLDTGTVRVERDGEILSLPRLSFRMLECLARHAPNAVSFDQLMDEVWEGVVVNQETVVQRAKLLREAIGDDSGSPQVIETVRGVGYRLIPAVAAGDAAASEPRHRGRIVLAAVALGAIIAVAMVLLSNPSKKDEAGQFVAIAVLPFKNMSAAEEQTYLADGLTVELTSLLTRIPELRVAAHTSAFSFKNSDAHIDTIADTLGVSYVLEGSVRRSDDDIRFSVQLIEAASGFNVWSETYERSIDAVFELQDEIAAAIVAALLPALRIDLPRNQATEPEAYAYYLRGRYLDNLKGEENWSRAVINYRRALDLDAEFAPAWAGLSLTYYYMTTSRHFDLDEGMAMAREAARRAIEIDPRQADAYATLSLVRAAYDWDFSGAAAAIEKALMLEPGNANVLNRAGHLAYSVGQLDDAIKLYRRSAALDPLSMSTQNALAIAYMASGDLDLAMSTLAHLASLNPDYPWVATNEARTLLLQGRPAEALARVDRIPSYEDHWRRSISAMASHALGRGPTADEALADFEREYGDASPVLLAEIHAWRNEIDAAFASLEKAVRRRDPVLTFSKPNPFLARLRTDERWSAIMGQVQANDLERIKLPDSF